MSSIAVTTILQGNSGSLPNVPVSDFTVYGAQTTSTGYNMLPFSAPVSGSPLALSALIPSTWTTIDEVHVINLDAASSLVVTVSKAAGVSPVAIQLAPVNGTDVLGQLSVRFNGSAASVNPAAPSAWTLASSSASLTCAAVLFIAGH